MQARRHRVGQVDRDPGGAVAQPGADQARPAAGAALLRQRAARPRVVRRSPAPPLRGFCDPAPAARAVRSEPPVRPGGPRRARAGRRRTFSVGSSSSACVITRACATLISPRPSASATRLQRRSSASASARSRRFAPKSLSVCSVSKAATSRAPSASATSSEAAITRSLQGSQLGVEPSQPQQRRPLVTGIHEHDLHPGALLERRLDGIGTRENRVRAAARRSNSQRHLQHRRRTMGLTCRCSVPVSGGPDGPGRPLSITIGSNLFSIIQVPSGRRNPPHQTRATTTPAATSRRGRTARFTLR